jgi:hypothetical protein
MIAAIIIKGIFSVLTVAILIVWVISLFTEREGIEL